MEVAWAFEEVVEVLDEAHGGDGVDVERVDDVLLRDVAEQCQPTETGGDHQGVDVLEAVEEGIVGRGEVEFESLHLLQASFLGERGLVHDIHLFRLRPEGHLCRYGETDAVGASHYEYSFHISVMFFLCVNRSITSAMKMLSLRRKRAEECLLARMQLMNSCIS